MPKWCIALLWRNDPSFVAEMNPASYHDLRDYAQQQQQTKEEKWNNKLPPSSPLPSYMSNIDEKVKF